MSNHIIDLTENFSSTIEIIDLSNDTDDDDEDYVFDNTGFYNDFISGILDPKFLVPNPDTPENRLALNKLIDLLFKTKKQQIEDKTIQGGWFHMAFREIKRELALLRGDKTFYNSTFMG